MAHQATGVHLAAQPRWTVRRLLECDGIGPDIACRSLSLECPPETRQELMESYLHLETFPEVQATLSKLSQYKLAILSNGSPKMLATAVKHAGLRGIFSDVISADVTGDTVEMFRFRSG